jgi:Spy/CpxP family protein refolding chaperone
MDNDFFDESAFVLLQEEYQLNLSENNLSRAKNHYEIMNILTEDQKNKLKQLKEKGHGKRNNR